MSSSRSLLLPVEKGNNGDFVTIASAMVTQVMPPPLLLLCLAAETCDRYRAEGIIQKGHYTKVAWFVEMIIQKIGQRRPHGA